MNAAVSPSLDNPWRHPANALRGRVHNWFHSRLPRTDTLTLDQRSVYIVPSRAGWMLGFTLLMLLIGSINYQLNLGYLLTFLLAGSAVVGMYLCHANLRGLTLHLTPSAPVHSGQAVALNIFLTSTRKTERHGIALGITDAGTSDDKHWVWTDVPAQGSSTVQVAWTPARRGQHLVPALTAHTLFPLGTFRVWTVWRPATPVLIYPAPEVHAPALPMGQPGGSGSARMVSSGEFDGVRAYRRGDPQKTVVWKKAAQSLAAGRADLVSRDAPSIQRQQLWLDFAQCGTGDTEARLSRLTAWVLMAERLGWDYGLRLPGRELAPDQGPTHRSRCLKALALA